MFKPKHILLGILFLLMSCSTQQPTALIPHEAKPSPQPSASPSLESIQTRFQGQKPKQFSEHVKGVVTRFSTQNKQVALTFDACGGKYGSSYDRELIEYLKQKKIPATLFINARWIDANRQIFLELAKEPLFEIENHGTLHRPLTVDGKKIYGIQGTRSIQEVVQEVKTNETKIEKLTGRKPKYFRSGTAYYDEVAAAIVRALGEIPVNFDIVGDAGATFSKQQVKAATIQAKPGSIIIYHMNQPNRETLEGLKEAIPILVQQGYQFVKLEDVLE